jgi:hypothetical protein
MKVAFSSCRAKVDFGLNLRVREGRSAPFPVVGAIKCEWLNVDRSQTFSAAATFDYAFYCCRVTDGKHEQ